MVSAMESARRVAALPQSPILLLLAGLVCGALFHWLAPGSLRHDWTTDYVAPTEALLEGRGLRAENGAVLTSHPPVFPVLLAAEYRFAEGLGLDRLTVTSSYAVLLLAATAALLGTFAGRRFGSRAGWVAWAGAMLGPPLLFATLRPLSVIPFLLALSVAVVSAVEASARERGKLRPAAASGAALGLGLLTRAIALYLPLLFAVLLVVVGRGARRARWASAAVLLLVAAAVIAPWILWLRVETGQWVPVASNAGRSLRDGLSFNAKEFREPLDLPAGVERVSASALARYEEIVGFGSYLSFWRGELLRSPGDVLQTVLYKSARAWYGTDRQAARLERGGLVLALGYLLATVGAAILLRRRRDGDPWARALILAVVATGLYFWGMATMALSIARYMIPVYALLPLIWAAALRAPGAGRLSGSSGGRPAPPSPGRG